MPIVAIQIAQIALRQHSSFCTKIEVLYMRSGRETRKKYLKNGITIQNSKK